MPIACVHFFVHLIKKPYTRCLMLTFYDFPSSSTVTVETAAANKNDGVAFSHNSSMEKPLLAE